MNADTVAVMPVTQPQANTLAEAAFCLAPAGTVRASVGLPASIGNSGFDGREFVMRAALLVTTGGAFTYAPSIRLYSGANTGATGFGGDTAIITPAALSIGTATRLIVIRAEIQWDPSGGTNARLNGRYTCNVDVTQNAWVTLTAGLTASVPNMSALQWCITGFFSSTSGSNVATLKYFELDLR